MREQDLRRLEFDKIKEKLKDFANSPATRELIDNLKPTSNIQELVKEINLCKAFLDIEDIPLYEFQDIRELLKRARIEGAVLSVEELLALLGVLKLVREVRKALGKYAESKEPLRGITRRLFLFSSLENLIESSIDRRGFVKDEASEELYRLRRSIRGIEKEIMDRLESLLRRPDSDRVFADKIITLRNNRYVVPVKSSQVKKVFGIVHGTSSSGYTTYVEPQFVVQLNNKLTELKAQEEEEVKKVLKRITSYVGDFADRIEESFQALMKVDLLNSKKKLSQLYNGRFPELGSFVELKGACHPVLKELKPDAVSIDIVLKEKKGLILTGPNTGGKTVALKTLGLITLMVQSAIPAPLKEGSTIKVFDKLFVDIGDEQSLEQNLSTFSSHMANIADFLPQVDGNTLVLLDELGAGTDPAEGSALGIGILEYLKGKGAWVFANTHHTPIKVYAVNSDYFAPASVLFDRETLQPLYRIAYNTIGESMAFEVANRCGIPQEVIDIAKKNLEVGGKEYISAMERLSDYTKEYERKLEELEKLKKELEEEKSKYQELRQELENIKKRGWKEAYKEARKYLRELALKGEELLRKARDKKDIEAFIKDQEKQLSLFVSKEEIRIEAGDKVEFMGKKGKVLEVKGNKARVNFDGMKLWISIEHLKKIEEEIPKGAESPHLRGYSKTEINLIGMDRDTAIVELERFLEEAFSSGHKSVKVVHGLGKGILKRAVQEFLSRHPRVKFFRDAYPREGGAGVTVVFLEEQEED